MSLLASEDAVPTTLKPCALGSLLIAGYYPERTAFCLAGAKNMPDSHPARPTKSFFAVKTAALEAAGHVALAITDPNGLEPGTYRRTTHYVAVSHPTAHAP